MTLQPIGKQQQQQVITLTGDYINRATRIFRREFARIPVLFDLTGRAAGMYRVRRGERVIRYNPYLFAKYFEDNLKVTVPHEVAHYITDCVYGFATIRPHGPQWRELMVAFGAEPKATSDYDLDGVPGRRQRRHPYHCGCTAHELTTVRHNKASSGRMRYYCKRCGGELAYQGGT